MVALAGHPFVLEISKATIHLTRLEKQAPLPSPTIFIYPLRDPPHFPNEFRLHEGFSRTTHLSRMVLPAVHSTRSCNGPTPLSPIL